MKRPARLAAGGDDGRLGGFIGNKAGDVTGGDDGMDVDSGVAAVGAVPSAEVLAVFSITELTALSSSSKSSSVISPPYRFISHPPMIA